MFFFPVFLSALFFFFLVTMSPRRNVAYGAVVVDTSTGSTDFRNQLANVMWALWGRGRERFSIDELR